MVQKFCASGEQEGVKGGVHAVAGAICAVMAIYNITAWCYRRETHLGINAIVYTLATAWEAKQTMHHVRHAEAVGRCTEVPEPAKAA